MSHPDLTICSFMGKFIALKSFFKKRENAKKEKSREQLLSCLRLKRENDFNALKECENVRKILTHISRMECHNPVRRTSPCPLLGMLGGTFNSYSNFNGLFCKQIVETLIRRRVLRRLILVSTVCRCPTKRTLSLYGLT